MRELGDNDLLAQYARNNSEEAFTALVLRHVDLVYSAALRQVSNPHHAEEITQVVFLVLAKKAKSLSPKVILTGWLYRTVRLTAANYLRMENRRQRREQEAYMQSLVNESQPDVWMQIAPMLDVAMEHLGERDRNAVLLRFFQSKSFKEVGSALGANEDTAQKRVERALSKLRNFFARRGIALSEVTLTGVLSTHSAQAAPVGLAKSVSAAVLTKATAASGTSLLLMKSTLKMMTWLKVKTAATATVSAILIAGTTTVAVAQIEKIIDRGRESISTGHYDQAIADFDQALQLDPNVPAAYFNRGRAHKLQGNYDQAIADYDQDLKLNPKAVGTYVNRGQIYNLKGDYDLAIADFDHALLLNPTKELAYTGRANSYIAKGSYDQAIADCNRAVALDPADVRAYFNRGRAYNLKGDYGHAIASYDRAIQLDPRRIAPYLNRGEAYASEGNYDKAIADFNAALAINPNFEPALNMLNMAKAHVALNQAPNSDHHEQTASSSTNK
jgi:RNA polymerase sigma factor (sigma-70 family)